MQGKLIIVSYRLPYRFTVTEGKLKVIPSTGGLATALHSYFEKEKANEGNFESFHWVGVSDISKRTFERVSSNNFLQDNNFTLHPTFIEGRDSDLFYNGFCNSVLWPLFHYFPSYVIYEEHFYDAYYNANQIMCDKIVDLYTPGDTIWIHDYHFMLLPEMLRKALPNAVIGFFLHIPFPSFELFRILPKTWRIGILHGLLGANVAGFHTDDYASHFRDSVQHMIEGSQENSDCICLNQRETLVRSFPISIDFDKFQNVSSLSVVKREVKKIKNRFNNNKLILSVDRLDYTKAIINRLESFELFLQQNPKYKEQVNYILLLVPSRDGILKYRENKREVETLISRINGLHGSLTWTPIIYQYRSIELRKLVALYSASDIALITPVRDGMNLVAKEYVASRTDSSGVLILSETAGCANELHEAIMVNPNDRHEIASSILQAITQPIEEQRNRISKMQNHLRQHTVNQWVTEFMQKLMSNLVEI
ncbi:MAG TPA: trehalose-6-phosphate synthase [Cyclobacteriaceae bacterium]|jgi:trehalose 6-phosphate synthase/phosphatase|nr:trehalose-6-phosphate synthase [Cyclobacteriaceae bacterium]